MGREASGHACIAEPEDVPAGPLHAWALQFFLKSARATWKPITHLQAVSRMAPVKVQSSLGCAFFQLLATVWLRT